MQSNYNSIFFSNVVNCNSAKRCEIVNQNQVSHLLKTYLSKLEEEIHSVTNEDSFRKSFREARRNKKNSNSNSFVDFLVVRSEKSVEEDNDGAFRDSVLTDGFCNNFQDQDFSAEREVSQNANATSVHECGTILGAEPTKKHDQFPKSISADRPHECSICMKAFKRKLHLKRHFTVAHSEEKNHACKICCKSFSRKDYLDKHIAGHVKRSVKLKLLKEGLVVRTKIRIS